MPPDFPAIIPFSSSIRGGVVMEAGYDYTLLGRQPRRPVWTVPAVVMAVLALALLTVGGAYYGFATQAQADGMAAAISAETAAAPAAKAVLPEGDSRKPAARPPRLQIAAIAGQQLYPDGRRQVASWVNPLAYEPEPGRLDTSFRWWAGTGSR